MEIQKASDFLYFTRSEEGKKILDSAETEAEKKNAMLINWMAGDVNNRFKFKMAQPLEKILKN